MEADIWKAVVAGVGAVTGISSLTWQVIQAARDRGRIKVHLHASVWSPDMHTLARQEDGIWPMPKHMTIDASDAIELALVTIENSSKYPLSVTEVSLQVSPDIGSARERKKLTRSATTKSFTLENPAFRIQEYEPNFRLEPYQQAEFLFDYWSLVESCRTQNSLHDVALRARSKVAGIRKPFLSPKKQRWLIPHNVVTGLAWYAKIPFAHLVRRVLSQTGSKSKLDEMPLGFAADDIANVIEAAYQSGKTPVHNEAIKIAKATSTFQDTQRLVRFEWFRLTEIWKSRKDSFTTPTEDPGQRGQLRD